MCRVPPFFVDDDDDDDNDGNDDDIDDDYQSLTCESQAVTLEHNYGDC